MPDHDNTMRYPVGIQTFSEIIEGGYVYADKTPFIHRLCREGKYYFLSRPRRFGKSLLLSTIEAYYSGRRDLFRGLALDSLTDDWDPHPVLHLDLNTDKYEHPDSLDILLSLQLREWEMKYGVETDDTAPLSYRFGALIRHVNLHTGKKVVILVDEYDKPMLSAIDNEPLADRFRATLKAFYGNLKSMDKFIEFAMLTGVARFSKVSIFSDLNNLRDISFEHKFSAICGLTDAEIDRYFAPGIRAVAAQTSQPYDSIRAQLRRRYDGYHFAEDLTDIYNPFSIVNFFASEKFDNYWFNSGTPSYVVRLLKSRLWILREVEAYHIDADSLRSGSIMSKEAIPTLYQAGYLTIKQYDPTFDQYTLGYPNAEVEESFIKFLRPLFLGDASRDSEFDNRLFVKDVLRGDPDAFMTRLDSLLRCVPHIGPHDPHEVFFQNAIYLIFKMVGFHTRMEDHTSNGRIDLSVETDRYVYIFEFKVNRPAPEAMDQIIRKQYWKKFDASGKKIFLIAASFDTSTRALSDLIISSP